MILMLPAMMSSNVLLVKLSFCTGGNCCSCCVVEVVVAHYSFAPFAEIRAALRVTAKAVQWNVSQIILNF